jgi:hypothetical protein
MRRFAGITGVRRAVGLALGALLLGCEAAPEPWQAADVEFRDFQAVFPVLMRDCGFHTCHGSDERFFRLYGPGRARLDSDTSAFDPLTGDEASASFQSARSFLNAAEPEQSLLLRKPLAVAAGGAGHEGVDPFGRNVYRSKDDSGYQALANWVLGGAESDAALADTEGEGP